MNTRLGGLDGLRALSVTLVLLIHTAHLPGFPAWPWLRRLAGTGGSGVSIFFVISGFLITWILLKAEKKQGSISLRDFYFRRALRILPPAFVYLAALALLGLANSKEILECVLFVRNLHPLTDAAHSLTGHFWSLSIEEQFYLIWPFLLWKLPTKWRIPLTTMLCVAAPVWRQTNIEFFGADKVNWFRMDLRYEYLLFGALLALTQKDARIHCWLDRAASRPTLAFSLCAGGLGVLCLGDLSLPGYVAVFGPSLFSVLIAFVIKLLIEERNAFVSRCFNWSPWVWIGRISYSLYLWHALFCFQTAWPTLRNPGTVIGLSLLAAAASFYLVEQPSQWLRDRLQANWIKPSNSHLAKIASV